MMLGTTNINFSNVFQVTFNDPLIMQQFIPQFDCHRYITVSWHDIRINITFILSLWLEITLSVHIKRLQNLIYEILKITAWARQLSRYSDWLRAGRSGDRIPVESRFPSPVQTGPVAHQASCTMGTGSFPGVKSGRGVTLTPHPLLVPWSWKGRAIPLLTLWAVRPVQSLSACTRVTFTFYLLKRTPYKSNIYVVEVPNSFDFKITRFKFYLMVSFKEKRKKFLA